MFDLILISFIPKNINSNFKYIFNFNINTIRFT